MADYIPAVCIFLDDTNASDWLAFQYMQPRNVRATAYCITDYINNSGRLTAEQMRTLDGHGWTIGNHTKTHPRLVDLTEAEIAEQIGGAITALEAVGITTGRHFCYPENAHNATVKAIMSDLGILTGRGYAVSYNDYRMHEIDWYEVAARDCGTQNTSLEDVLGYIDSAIAEKKIAGLLFHRLVTDTPTLYTWALSDFQAVIDYIIAQQIAPLTIEHLYHLRNEPLRLTLPWDTF
jgi:peptidoglycan/xylan/chitin deacetylase (PgdA/CDA1 family)